jgi:hypothetical protein
VARQHRRRAARGSRQGVARSTESIMLAHRWTRALASCIFLRRNISADLAINESEINLSLDMAVPPIKRKSGTGD